MTFNQLVLPKKDDKPDARQALIYIGQAKFAIARLKLLNDTAKMRNLLDFMERESQRQGLEEVEKKVVEAKFALLAKTGEMIIDLKTNADFGKPGPRSVQNSTDLPTTLKAAGITKNESVKAQTFAKLPEPAKEKIVRTATARVGQPRKRREVIDELPSDHQHLFVFCSCGAKMTFNDALVKSK